MTKFTVHALLCMLSLVASLRVANPRMAGFGSVGSGGRKKASKAKAKPTGPGVLSPKKQWDRFKEHRDAGSPKIPVFARVCKTDTWHEVGDVTVAGGAALPAVVQLQKRLILEHAVRVHPQLLRNARELECGYGEPTMPHQKTEAAEAVQGGFVGRPDASGRYGKTEADIQEKEPSSLQAATSSVAQGGTNRDSKGRVG